MYKIRDSPFFVECYFGTKGIEVSRNCQNRQKYHAAIVDPVGEKRLAAVGRRKRHCCRLFPLPPPSRSLSVKSFPTNSPCPLFSQSLFRTRSSIQRILVFTCKIRRRYSREQASRSLEAASVVLSCLPCSVNCHEPFPETVRENKIGQNKIPSVSTRSTM